MVSAPAKPLACRIASRREQTVWPVAGSSTAHTPLGGSVPTRSLYVLTKKFAADAEEATTKKSRRKKEHLLSLAMLNLQLGRPRPPPQSSFLLVYRVEPEGANEQGLKKIATPTSHLSPSDIL